MITVISPEELTHLISFGSIKSDEFLRHLTDSKSKKILAKILSQVLGRAVQTDFVALLHGTGDIIDESIVETFEGDIVDLLPLPLVPVYLVLSDDVPCVKISIEDMEFINMIEEAEYSNFISFFSNDQFKDGTFRYAFLDTIRVADVKKILYAPKDREIIESIKMESTQRTLIFKETNLFSR